MNPTPTTILLVDDHPLFRKGLHALLSGEEDMRVISEAGDGRTAIQRVREVLPDVVVMDITMPNFNGIDATRQIVSAFPGTRVVALSVHSGKQFVEGMLAAGAAGYILKLSAPEDLVKGIRAVMRGDVYLSPDITGVVVSQYLAVLSGIQESKNTAGLTQNNNDLPILRTKLQHPAPPADVVTRDHLASRIDEILGRPLTLVSAGAGFGKSTVASLWVESWDGPHVWISLDEEVNNLRTFLSYLLAGIRQMFPGTCDKTQSLLHSLNLPPFPVLSRYLLNDLNEIEASFIIVLDDYHKIHENRVHELLSAILTYPPPNLHLIILTRRDPPLLHISKLRGRGKVNEISTVDLQFTVEETALFFNNSLGLSVDHKTAGTIQEKLDGWPVGMRLMSHSLKDKGNLEHLMAGLKGSFSAVVDYLVAEVLSQQSPQMKNVLARTAILDRFCAPLVDAIGGSDAEPGRGRIDGAAFIAMLKKDNLFLIALDMDNRWFRYHHLFQHLLKQRLKRQVGPEEITRLYSRAGAWFADNGLIEDAIKYALEGGDDLAAAKIVERNRQTALDADRWHVFKTWLDRLPHEIKQQRPDLLLGQAWILVMMARIADILPIIERTESLLAKDPKDPVVWSEINFFRGLVCYFQGDSARSVAYFNQATKLLPETAFLFLRSEVRYWTCVALHLDGRKATAFQKLYDGVRSEDYQEGMPLSRLSFGLCFLHMLEGDYLKAYQEAVRLRRIGRSNHLVSAETWGVYVQGNASFQMFDLDTAHHQFGLIAENPYIANMRAAVDAMAGLSITLQLMGKADQADEAMHSAHRFADWTKDPVNSEIVRSCRARLALLRNDLDSALRWQRSLGESPGTPLMLFFLEIPLITQCRVLIAMGSDAGLK